MEGMRIGGYYHKATRLLYEHINSRVNIMLNTPDSGFWNYQLLYSSNSYKWKNPPSGTFSFEEAQKECLMQIGGLLDNYTTSQILAEWLIC